MFDDGRKHIPVDLLLFQAIFGKLTTKSNPLRWLHYGNFCFIIYLKQKTSGFFYKDIKYMFLREMVIQINADLQSLFVC